MPRLYLLSSLIVLTMETVIKKKKNLSPARQKYADALEW